MTDIDLQQTKDLSSSQQVGALTDQETTVSEDDMESQSTPISEKVSETESRDDQKESVLLDMAKAGVMYGHKKSRRNPHFGEYVFAVRNGVEVIDLEQTLEHIDTVANALKEFKKEGKEIMVVGTQLAAREAVRKLAEVLGGSYIVNKWIGGLLTNFDNISGRIDYYKERKKGEKDGTFDDYTKKERLDIHREVEKMGVKFEGVEELKKVPDVMFLIDTTIKGHQAALREARRKGVTLIGIIDNDDNPKDVDLFIPANDHARASIEWVVNRIIDKYQNSTS